MNVDGRLNIEHTARMIINEEENAKERQLNVASRQPFMDVDVSAFLAVSLRYVFPSGHFVAVTDVCCPYV